MKSRIIAIFHGKKADVGKDAPIELKVNQPLSEAGMLDALRIAKEIEAYGPFRTSTIYSGFNARCLSTTSVIAMHNDIPQIVIDHRLAQWSSDYDGVDMYYPGHEQDNCTLWQINAVEAVRHIVHIPTTARDARHPLVMVSSRPMIGGLIAYTQGITDEEGIKSILLDSSLVGKGYRIFTIDEDGTISLEL